MKDVLQAINERCSTRGYTEEKLTKEEIETLVRAGLQAPTATNRQEIHISVLDGSHPILAEIEQEKNAGRDIQNPPHNFYYEAPTVMILSGEAGFKWSAVDAGIAVQSIALAAEGMGLGSLIIGCIRDAMEGEKKEYFANALHFPQGYVFEIAIALGHQALGKKPHGIDEEKNVSYIV